MTPVEFQFFYRQDILTFVIFDNDPESKDKPKNEGKYNAAKCFGQRKSTGLHILVSSGYGVSLIDSAASRQEQYHNYYKENDERPFFEAPFFFTSFDLKPFQECFKSSAYYGHDNTCNDAVSQKCKWCCDYQAYGDTQ